MIGSGRARRWVDPSSVSSKRTTILGTIFLSLITVALNFCRRPLWRRQAQSWGAPGSAKAGTDISWASGGMGLEETRGVDWKWRAAPSSSPRCPKRTAGWMVRPRLFAGGGAAGGAAAGGAAGGGAARRGRLLAAAGLGGALRFGAFGAAFFGAAFGFGAAADAAEDTACATTTARGGGAGGGAIAWAAAAVAAAAVASVEATSDSTGMLGACVAGFGPLVMEMGPTAKGAVPTMSSSVRVSSMASPGGRDGSVAVIVLFIGCTKMLSLAPEYMIVSSHAIVSLALILPCAALALCTGVTWKVPGTGMGTAFCGGGMAKAGIMGSGATSTETGAIGATAADAIGGGGGGAIGGGAAGAEASGADDADAAGADDAEADDAEAGGAGADDAEAGGADADSTGAEPAEPASIVTSVSVKRSSSTVEGTGMRSLKLAEGMVKEMRWPVGGTRADTLAPVTRGGAMPMVATKIFLPAGAASFASYTASSDRCTGRLDTTTGGAPPKVTGYLEATDAQKACAFDRRRSWAALSSARALSTIEPFAWTGRKTVTAMDVVYALRRQGRTLYGFGG